MKEKIWQTFLEMMLQDKQLFSEIRIGELCQKATIHRSTFYRHFEDKYQLLEYGLTLLWKDYFNINATKKFYTPFQTANEFFEQSTAKQLIKSQSSDDEFNKTVDNVFFKQMMTEFLAVLDEYPTTLPRELLAHFIPSTIQAVEEWAASQKENMTPKELDYFYQELVLKTLARESF